MAVRFHSILMNMLLLLVTVILRFSQTDVFPQVVPNRQQHFQYEAITVSCEGLNGMTGWRVMKKVKRDIRTCASNWQTSAGACTILNAYPSSDSGEYWCEIGGRKRSNAVNITVTDSPVILEIPVHPLMEGDNVTFHCRKKQMNSTFAAEFYKDGNPIGLSSTGNIMNPTVSKSDEGFYRCSSIPDGVESAESWLAVEAHVQTRGLQFHFFLVLCTGVGSALLVVLLLLVGLLQCQKRQQISTGHTAKTSLKQSAETSTVSFQSTSSPQTVSAEARSTHATYVLLTKPRMIKEPAVASWSETVPGGTNLLLTEEDVDHCYCTIPRMK